MRFALVALVLLSFVLLCSHSVHTEHHTMSERTHGTQYPITRFMQIGAGIGDIGLGSTLIVHDSPEVRTLRVWSDANWWQTSAGTSWSASAIVTESTGGTTLARRRVFRPRGFSMLVPAGVQVTVNLVIGWTLAGPMPPVNPNQKAYATISPGMPQERHVYGGQAGPDLAVSSFFLDPDNDQDPGSRIYGCKFADSVLVSWQQPAAGGIQIDYQGGIITLQGLEGSQRLSLDHKAHVIVPANSTFQWTWSTFE